MECIPRPSYAGSLAHPLQRSSMPTPLAAPLPSLARHRPFAPLLATPDDMRGRVSAVNSLFIGTSNTLGEFESGVTTAWFGVVPAVLIGGVGTVLIALIAMGVFPGPLRIDTLERS
jgi:hypothetical protein